MTHFIVYVLTLFAFHGIEDPAFKSYENSEQFNRDYEEFQATGAIIIENDEEEY